MSLLRCRRSIALTAFLIALISSKKSDAQVYAVGPPRESGTPLNELVTGVKYDRINQALAFRRLEKLQAKIRVDAERGDPAAVDRDARRITSTRYRISIDEWLIQKNSLQEPCFYPAPIPTDQLTCEAIAAASRPAPSYYIIQR